MKILIVEDEPTSLKLAHLVLSNDGYEVTQAEAAEKAIEEIKRSVPEVILLDLELPGVLGLTLARQLKANPQTRHITIIAITSFPERYSRADALAAGCDGYIIKPIDTRLLSRQVAEVVDRSG
jgi:CheY-like chemotaxis protein